MVLASLDDPAEVGRLAHEALASGPVDILINCAGAASEPHRWFDGPADAWQRQFQTSTFYAVQLIQTVVPTMRQRGWARLTPFMKRVMIPEDPRVFGSGDRP